MRRFWILLALLVGIGLTTPVSAQGPANRVGLVVRHSDGRVLTACVEFSEPAITGFELLLRAGLDASMEVQGDAAICSINGDGCRFPAESCFCQCQTLGSACNYWVYSHLIDGRWVYSQVSASIWEVRDGDVDGWAWGRGSGDESVPPVYTFDQICANGPFPATLVGSEQTTSQAEPTPSPAPSPTTEPAVDPTETPPAPASEEPTPAPASPTTRPAQPTETPAAPASGEPTSSQLSPTARPARPTATVEPRPTEIPTRLAMGNNSNLQPAEEEESGDRPAPAAGPGIPVEYVAFGAIAILLLAGIAWSRRR